MKTSKSIQHHPVLLHTGDFVFFMARRLYRDHCAQTAASLTYTSLLALIPFLVVGFSILREFPVFPELLNLLQEMVLRIFTPATGEGVINYIQHVVNKGTKLPVLSFLILIITSVMMLYTIDDTLNRIWRVEYQRRTFISLLIYLGVVLSGPVLLGSSLAITTYLVSQSQITASIREMHWLAGLPWLVTFIAFTALYRWVPNTRVAWKYAVSGGLVAMLLFELAKWGFALYMRWVPTYGLLYGALAAFPLTLVWIYLSWLVVLIGAEMARCLSIYSHEYKQPELTARKLLGFFFASQDGVAIGEITAAGHLGRRKMKMILQRLQMTGLVYQQPNGKYELSQSAASMSITELMVELTQQMELIEN